MGKELVRDGIHNYTTEEKRHAAIAWLHEENEQGEATGHWRGVSVLRAANAGQAQSIRTQRNRVPILFGSSSVVGLT